MSENPYEATEVATNKRPAAIPMTVTWPRIWLTTLVTSVIMLAGFTTLMPHSDFYGMQAQWAGTISGLLGLKNGLAILVVSSIAVVMPYVWLTLIVFISLLRLICRQNPYEASDAVTDKGHSVNLMTVTWPRVFLAVVVTTAITLAICVTLLRYEEVLMIQFRWAETVCGLLLSDGTNFENSLSAPMVYSIVICMPYVLLTLAVFMSVLRLICRPSRNQSQSLVSSNESI